MPALFKVTLLALASASLALALTDPGVAGRNNTPQAPHQERIGAGLERSVFLPAPGTTPNGLNHPGGQVI
jgi:hypothetical protein